MKTLVPEYFHETLPSYSDTVGNRQFDELDPEAEDTVRYACADADYALRLYHLLNNWFDRFLPKLLKFKAGLDVSLEECERIISNLKSGYPRLSRWQEEIKTRARFRQYTETWLGRRRNIPDIASSNWNKRSFAERVAMNTPIQGTAADILKLSMGRIIKGLPEKPWLMPLLQIHDELVFEIPEGKLAEAVKYIKNCMEEKPFPEFPIPIIAEAAAGHRFGELYELEFESL